MTGRERTMRPGPRANPNPATMDQLEKRTQLIRIRVESLERRKLVLKSHEKWPTVKSVRQYQARMNSFLASENKSAPPPSASQLGLVKIVEPSSSFNTNDTKTPPPGLSSFPFPISRVKNDTSFPQFSHLPPELRLKIWELALLVPKFIEAQFCTQFYEAAFVNCAQRDVLFSVCHESRAIALTLAPDIKYLQALTWITTTRHYNLFQQPRLGSCQRKPWPNKTIHFAPERDTIFFRSLNCPARELDSFMFEINGIENIQHLAIPLQQKGLPRQTEWGRIVSYMKALKTLTFMVGSKEKSWRGTQRSIELRDVEQWYVDGRSRKIFCGGSRVDVRDVGTFMTSPPHKKAQMWYVPGTRQERTISVRVVAWKRGGRS